MKKLCILLLCIFPLISCSQSNKTGNSISEAVSNRKPEDRFTTLRFELEGKPCIAIINNQYKDFKSKSLFPLSLFITVNTKDKDKNGHPTEKEAETFYSLQTKIMADLSAEFLYCHVGTTTMTGYRDILLYINSRDQIKATTILDKIKNDNDRFTSYTFEPDPEWDAVASFYEAVPAKN